MRHEPADTGSGFIFGIPLNRDECELNHQIGYVTETIDYAIGGSTELLCKTLLPRIYRNWDRELFATVATELSLDLKKKFSQLSRGQKMQVAFAVALSIRPKLLLLDEITSVLDARVRAFFMSHLSKLVKNGSTVVMATNIISEIHNHADQLLLLEGGRICLNSAMSEVSKQFKKFRKATSDHHALSNDPACLEIGINADGTVSYIITSESAMKYEIPDQFRDGRAVTAEDAFIYFTGRRQ
jgi:ABC-2 type transport system ATP-binding protein